MGTTADPVPSWADRRFDTSAAVARLRESWAWLDELVEPGPETSAGRVLTDADRKRQAAEAAEDRAVRLAGLRVQGDVEDPGAWYLLPQGGDQSALAPSPSPVRLAVVELQTYLADRVRRVVARAHHHGTSRPPRAGVLGWLDWLDGPFAAPLDLLPGGTLAWVADQLDHVDQLARQAAGVVGERVAPLPDRCPACRRKSLQLLYTGDDRKTWAVLCASASCLCTGTGCPCRAAVRYEGRRHVWAYGELDGRSGLWAAITAVRRAPVPIRHSAAGHGHASAAWSRWSQTADLDRSGDPMHIVTDTEGVRWADTATVLAQLDVKRKLLNDWVRRGLVAAPRPAGGRWWYALDQCIEAERETAESGLSTRDDQAT